MSIDTNVEAVNGAGITFDDGEPVPPSDPSPAVEASKENDEILEGDEASTAAPKPEPKPRTAPEDPKAKALRALGLTNEQILETLALMASGNGNGGGKKQRTLPLHVTVCDPKRIEHYAGRSDDEIVLDFIKAIRNDGGNLGVQARYEQLIEGLSDDAARAAAIRGHADHRILQIRRAGIGLFNELRRRKEEREGRDPRKAVYLTMP